ncbi:MAG: thiamine pyrophosphate-dependent enzyme [Lyngbya sp.]|nr:thiamine pyrophosphate-dependent enzyme [Lyngbya sp.]
MATQNPLIQKPSGTVLFPAPHSTQPLKIQSPAQITTAQAIVQMLQQLGVQQAFGVSGGAVASLWAAMSQSPLEVLHFRHESGAVFAAVEANLANNKPVVVFTTTGPGLTNAITGLYAARWEGAKVIFISPATAVSHRERWAFQETSHHTMPSELFHSGRLFHYATSLESPEQLPEVSRRLTLGLTRPGGFIAHLSVPTTVQSSPITSELPPIKFSQSLAVPGEDMISEAVQQLSEGNFAIWVGFGARGAATEIRQLAERTGAAVMCSPRGKGIFPEDHPQFIGVTGFGGHSSVVKYMQEHRPMRVLVLGTRLSEFTSFWSPAMVPQRGFIQVDIDPQVFGVAYPEVETLGIQSDVGLFIRALLKYFPPRGSLISQVLPRPEQTTVEPLNACPVRPSVLMDAIQRVIVEQSNAIVITEAGNSFAWGTNRLRFQQPGRYRVSTGFGSMGHAATGVLGAALAGQGKAVAIVGDGAMLMNSEISTAVQHQIPALWVVLNDGRYNMCAQGMAALGYEGINAGIGTTNFVMMARALGAAGVRVSSESELETALKQALATAEPFVIDVVIDESEPAPCGSRIQSLKAQ